MGELGELAKAYRDWQGEGIPIAVATVVGAKGSVYRREGAKMLLAPPQGLYGTISGGCLEPELLAVAEQALPRGEGRTLTYDLSEDTMWGLGIGCAGTVQVRLSPLSSQVVEAWERVEAHREVWAVVELLQDGPPRRVRVGPGPQGEITGDLDAFPPQVWDQVRARMQAGTPGQVPCGDTMAFVDVLTPVPLLVLFGAGHDAVPVAEFAQKAGFAVRVVDGRLAYATSRRFPGAEIVHEEVLDLPVEAVHRLVPPGSFAVVMHHHKARDESALALLSHSQARYVGQLGPRSRTQEMLASLRAQGRLGPAFGERGDEGVLSSPVGLDLGAEGPEAIAVAIVAELLAVRHGRPGGRLNGRVGPIHAERWA